MADSALTTRAYWESRQGKARPFVVEANPLGDILERYLPVDPALTCVEIGAYPGANLCWLARRFGYRPTAIEYREDAEDMKDLFLHNGIPGLTVIREDFRNIRGLAFDVVASLGFVEHFREPREVVARHAAMVKDGGFLVLSVPHFGGLQALFRRLLLRTEGLKEMLAVHNLDIMNLRALVRLLKSLDLEILFADYAMGFRFWVPWNSPQVRAPLRGIAWLLNRVDRHCGPALPSCRLLSPMILTVSRKPGRRGEEGAR